jgi:hypothetical protein
VRTSSLEVAASRLVALPRRDQPARQARDICARPGCSDMRDSGKEIYGTSRGDAAGILTSIAFFIDEDQQLCRRASVAQRAVVVLQADAIDLAKSAKAV